MNIIKQYLLLILSVLPVFAITDDCNFGTVEKKENTFWRFSLLQLMCGATKFYFISWKKNKDGKIKFMFAKKQSLKDCYLSSRSQASENVKKYKIYLKEINKQQILEEREDLCYHINNEQERIETSDNKINIYTTIVLTVTPIVMAIIDWNKLWGNGFLTKTTLCVIAYLMLNIIMYVYGYLKVGSYKRYGFCEIKIPKNEKRNRKAIIRKRNELLYSDWQNLRVDANIKVSYVLNLQKWVALVFVIVIFLMLLA